MANKTIDLFPEITTIDDSVEIPVQTPDGTRKIKATALKGQTGATGPQGIQGTTGATGATGATPNITIGTTTTLAAGSNATVTITGTATNPILNFGIPKGADGTGGTGSTVEVINDLVTGGTTKALSAEQGIVLKALIDEIINIRLDGYSIKWVTQATHDELEATGQFAPMTEYHVIDSNEPSVPEIVAGNEGQVLAVKSDGTGLEYVDAPTGSGTVDLTPYQTKVDNNITGTDKNIVNVINSNTDKIDILNNTVTDHINNHPISNHVYKLVLNGTDLKLMVDGVEEASVSLEDLSNGVIEVFGDIVVSTTTLDITEGSSKSFTVKLSQQPTNDQVVTLTKTNADVTLDKTSLTFTNANWNTEQTVNVTVAEDDTDYNNETDTITLTSPNVSDKTISVNITDNDIAVTGVTLDVTTVSISVGSTQQLTATITPSTATNKNVEWTSSDEAIATVDSAGKVTSVAEGSCTITCTSVVDSSKFDVCAITVTANTGSAEEGLLMHLNYAQRGSDNNVWTDISGNNNHATLVNFSHNATSGWSGTGLAFSKSTTIKNYLMTNFAPCLNTGTLFRLEIYCNSVDTDYYSGCIASCYDETTYNTGFWIGTEANKTNDIKYWCRGIGGATTTATTIIGETKIVIYRKDNSVICEVNDVAIAKSGVINSNTTTTPLVIGAGWNVTANTPLKFMGMEVKEIKYYEF